MDEKYYRLLKRSFPSKESVLTEILNLNTIRELPKGTEHFVSDLHGEFKSFDYAMRSGSGSIKNKIKECFPNFSFKECSELSSLVYYPKEKIEVEKKKESFDKWTISNSSDLVELLILVGKKYTRSKVRKTFPNKFQYIIEELVEYKKFGRDQIERFNSLISKLIEYEKIEELMESLAYIIQKLSVDHLHVVGDIYDRGPLPDKIVDKLMSTRSVDIQWGNHDIIWMAAISGSPVAIMNIIRISSRYNNIDILEKSYGISLRPIIEYADKHYSELKSFEPKTDSNDKISNNEKSLLNKLQQATAIIQFKLESQLIHRRPDFSLNNRDLLNFINYEKNYVEIETKKFILKDFNSSTINPMHPEELTEEEEKVIKEMIVLFQSSEKLLKHVGFLLEKGSMYLLYNNNLLFHGCVPLNEDGSLKVFEINEQKYSGKNLFDFFEKMIRRSFLTPNIYDDLSTDLLYYLWIGECSPLFGKKEMTTFERYYIEDKGTHNERKNQYYELRNHVSVVENILSNFGLTGSGHVVNGHTPVKEKKGESPIKAKGRLIVIDGGFSKAYQNQTGVAGYTLLYNSYGLQIVTHQPFFGVNSTILDKKDNISFIVTRNVDEYNSRILVRDTTIGVKLIKQISDLEYVLNNFDNL